MTPSSSSSSRIPRSIHARVFEITTVTNHDYEMVVVVQTITVNDFVLVGVKKCTMSIAFF